MSLTEKIKSAFSRARVKNAETDSVGQNVNANVVPACVITAELDDWVLDQYF